MKSVCAPKYPISVRRLPLSCKLDGDCRFKDDFFLIRINKDLPEHEAIETFLHELAHCHAWLLEEDVHGDEWGKAYSRVYRAFLKEFLEKEGK